MGDVLRIGLDARAAARALGGEVARGDRLLVPGPGHSRYDRSLSVLISDSAPDGFVVFSHAGDDPMVCKDYVRKRLGLRSIEVTQDYVRLDSTDDVRRTEQASEIWMAAVEPAGTAVEAYLISRGIRLSATLRWHPHCPFAGKRTGAMVALVTDISSNYPRAIHRTALSPEGRKIVVAGHDRLSLGPIAGGAVKLSSDMDVTVALGIGEGIETTLSLRRLPPFGTLPVWSLLAANGIRSFPVLAGVEGLFIAVDQDDAGRSAATSCGERWNRAGAEVTLVEPMRADDNDINDVVRSHAA
ncbi:MAG: toprim domain-containing protein [Bosea sp.]|nr:toprim domain-containing protein [Bosea sp. (in: a-proteobacteria)]